MNSKDKNNDYALITGASHGIGKALAQELAGMNYNLILVALPGKELDEAVIELKTEFNIDIQYLGIDLTHQDSPREIYEFVISKNLSPVILINNAGLGTSGMFHRSDQVLNNYMIMLNNQAMVGITHHFINMMLKQPRAMIMNVSSMEATLPLPYKSVYTATKAFIYSFSLALNEELKNSNITVSVLCPGSVLTNEDGLKRIKAMGWQAKLLVEMPDFVARKAVINMFKGKLVIIPGFVPYAIVKIMKFIPTGLKMKILEKIFRAYRDH